MKTIAWEKLPPTQSAHAFLASIDLAEPVLVTKRGKPLVELHKPSEPVEQDRVVIAGDGGKGAAGTEKLGVT